MKRYIDKDILSQTIDELVYDGAATPQDILDAIKDIIDDVYHTTGILVVFNTNSVFTKTFDGKASKWWVRVPKEDLSGFIEKESRHE